MREIKDCLTNLSVLLEIIREFAAVTFGKNWHSRIDRVGDN